MITDIIIEDARWEGLGLEALAEAAFATALGHFGIGSAEVSLLACDDARIAALNAEFRARAQPTNVLSWPSAERGAEEPGARPLAPQEPELGDIAIAWETCDREATEADKPLADHVRHLLVHALLHLLGYDHIDDKDAALMERLEVEILGKMGLADPYGTAGG